LTHIALRELGSAKLAERVANYNGVSLEKILKPGDTLMIPVTLPVRDEFATILYTKGDVELNGDEASTNDEVRLNDVITTGSSGFASLSFQTGTLINLQPNTVARLVTLFCQPDDEMCVIEMAADQGTITTDVRKDGTQPTDFRVQTPYASAAVRGTIFDLTASPDGLKVGVTEGVVGLENDTSEIGLEEGFGSVSKPGGPIGRPIALLPAPIFRFVPPRLAVGDRLRWFGLTDTEEYIVQITTSASGVGVVLDKTVDSDVLTLEDADLPAGDHTLWVRAVDPNGLKGFSSNSPIALAQLDDQLPAVKAAVVREDNSYFISIVNPPTSAAGYEIQVASDAEFSDPVSVDIDQTGQAFIKRDGSTLFARARVLVNRTTVGPFGQTTTVND